MPSIHMTPAAPAEFVAVCDVEELPIGLGRAFQVGPAAIAIFRTRRDHVFAIDNRCPHKGGPMAEGMLAGDQAVCPLHSFRFESASGRCDQEGMCPIAVYPLEIRDGQVFVNPTPLNERR
ncbi:MAG TPA: nitrite reductase small subunit NirD [Phycisphaerae bacterium]|nr:nitrite reductase small subunit NirD [Phycisphaerae bacterium]